jgi:hypothetical protein
MSVDRRRTDPRTLIPCPLQDELVTSPALTQHRPVDRNSRRQTGCAPPPASAVLNEVRDPSASRSSDRVGDCALDTLISFET